MSVGGMIELTAASSDKTELTSSPESSAKGRSGLGSDTSNSGFPLVSVSTNNCCLAAFAASLCFWASAARLICSSSFNRVLSLTEYSYVSFLQSRTLVKTSKTEVLQTPSAIEVNLGQGVK